ETVSSSQWGAVRTYATHAGTIRALGDQLFLIEKDKTTGEKVQKGYVVHGEAYERVWSKKGGLKTLKNVFEVPKNHKHLDTLFIAKFSGEMAKHVQKLNN